MAAADVVITTALVPGKRAPVLITEEMVQGMRPGSVIVDLAAEQGGNCASPSRARKWCKHGVVIVGPINLPSTVPYHASQMYARTVTNYLLHLLKDGSLQLDLSDELTRGPLVTHQGEIVHEVVKATLATLMQSWTRESIMQPTPIEVGLYIFILAGFSAITSSRACRRLLHTPLMSATNAISGISLIGSLVVVGARYTTRSARSSASSPWPVPRRTSSAASSSPTACSPCSRASATAQSAGWLSERRVRAGRRRCSGRLARPSSGWASTGS